MYAWPIEFEGESWITFGPPNRRRRIAFHDYAALYAEPGLYDAVFHDRLQMRTTERVVGLYGEVLGELGRPPSGERVLDLGAGNGSGGEALRRVGVQSLVAVDIEPAAQNAAERDRPGTYDDYVVVPAGAPASTTVAALGDRRFTALLALSSVGEGHLDAETLADLARELLAEDALIAFAVEAGIADVFRKAFADHIAVALHTAVPYVHRLRPDGTEHRATGFVWRRIADH